MGRNIAPELRKFLRQNGCVFVRRGKGDHEIWRSPHSGIHFSVPTKIVSRHTANAICKKAGLPKEF